MFVVTDQQEGHSRHEQRGPATLFSASAFAQVQLRALFSPQEHLAWLAQTQFWPSFLQQVLGATMLMVDW